LPIFAESPYFHKSDRKNRVPPIIADIAIARARMAGTWMFLGSAFNEYERTTIPKVRIVSPMNAWMIRDGPTLTMA
jgi:hypothetical protein